MNLQGAEGFSTAAGAFGVRVCEDKFRFQFGSDVVHFCAGDCEYSLGIDNNSDVYRKMCVRLVLT